MTIRSVKRLAALFAVSLILLPAAHSYAQVTPDQPAHPEINERLWRWMDEHFTAAFREYTRDARALEPGFQVDASFVRQCLSDMENDGFRFDEEDRNSILSLRYRHPKWVAMALCRAQIGPYIQWTIEDHYAFTQLMLKTGIYENAYGFVDALPDGSCRTSEIYRDALDRALERYPQMAETLETLDAKVEYQRYSHPDFASYELWSVLWYNAATDEQYTLCAKYYVTENEYFPAGTWHVFDFE